MRFRFRKASVHADASGALPFPNPTSVAPDGRRQGTLATVLTVTGTSFVEGCVASFSGSGVDVLSTTFLSSTSLTLSVDVTWDASIGEYDLAILNPDLQMGVLKNALEVTAGIELFDPPVLTSITPESGERDEDGLEITVTGTDFVDGAEVVFSGTGITVVSTEFVSATELTVTIDIAGDATLGDRDMTVYNPDAQSDILEDVFEVETAGGGLPMTAANRTSGVAPLLVVFDAVNVGVGSTGMVQAASGNFNDHDYRWGFDDAGSGTFTALGGSKNRATGQIAAHVFESEGTYAVTCTLTEADGTQTEYEQTITVTDPETVYADAATQYFAADGDDGNDGTEAEPRATIAAAMAWLFGGPGPRRVLFNKGDTFVMSVGTSPGAMTGPYHIGAYGTGDNPIFNVTGSSVLFAMNKNTTDVRIVDIDIIHVSGAPPTCLRFGQDSLALRLTIDGFDVGFNIDTDGGYDGNGLSECTITDSGHYGFYVANGSSVTDVVEHVAVLDCHFDQTSANSLFRCYASRSAIQGNFFGRSTQNQFRIMGVLYSGATPQVTQHVCITDNDFAAITTQLMELGPENDTPVKRVQNVLVDSNRFRYYGSGGGEPWQAILCYADRYITIRNNVYHLPSFAGYFVTVTQRGGSNPIPQGIRIYNNSGYNDNASETSYIVSVATAVTDPVLIKNNAFWNPNIDWTVKTGSGAATSATNHVATDPLFVDPDAFDFHIEAGSACAGTGADSIVRYDADWVSRAGGDGTDIGAYEYTVVLDPPTLTSILPEEGTQGDTGLEITFTGTDFVDGAVATFSGTGITVNSTTWVSATELTVDIDIAGGATLSARNVTVTNPDAQADSLTAAFTVEELVGDPPPTFTSITPDEGEQGATALELVVAGTDFVTGADVTFSGTGITVNSTTFDSSTQLTVDIDIDGAATVSARNVTVTNPDMQTDVGTGAFEVTAAAAFTPFDLFLGGDKGGWWDFSDLATMWQGDGITPVTTAGQTVYQVDNKGILAGADFEQATAGSRPTYLSGGGVSFDGTADFMDVILPASITDATLSLFIVFQPTTTVSGRRVVSAATSAFTHDYNDDGRAALLMRNGGATDFIAQSNSNDYGNSGTAANGSKHLFSSIFNGTTHTMGLSGTETTPVARTAAFNVDRIALCKTLNESEFFAGNVYEVVLIDRVLDAGEKTAVISYLETKWSV